MRRTVAVLLLAMMPSVAMAKGKAIAGTVVDRNGQPVEKVNVSLNPGNVELVTDQDGAFRFEYLRDEAGERVKLARKTTYQVTCFKVGYHEATVEITYQHGELILEPLTLKEDTIRVENIGDNIDPGVYSDKAQNSGGSYEGE
jgi:hypothetical protein